MTDTRPEIVAQPTAEHDWEVRSGDWDGGNSEGNVIGFIAEVGGIYEVESLTGTRAHEYCASFKEAMECFEVKE